MSHKPRVAVFALAALATAGLVFVTVQDAQSQVGGAQPAFVRLQPTDPGTLQTGNSRVSGVARSRQVIAGTDNASPRLSIEARSPVVAYALPTVGATNGDAWIYLLGSDDSNSHAVVWERNGLLRFGSEENLGASGFTEHMRIAANGNVGVGTSTPADRLSVAGDMSVTEAGAFASEQVRLGRNVSDGLVAVYDSSARLLAVVLGINGAGAVGVSQPGAGSIRAGAAWESATQRAVVFGDVKNFIEPSRSDPNKDYWYASIEGPEAGMYVRGSARLQK
jgi:hypothetical protein